MRLIHHQEMIIVPPFKKKKSPKTAVENVSEAPVVGSHDTNQILVPPIDSLWEEYLILSLFI